MSTATLQIHLRLLLPIALMFMVGSATAKADTIYVANGDDGTISVTTGPGSTSTFASGLGYPFGLAQDSLGNLYATCGSTLSLDKITPAGQVSAVAHFGYSGLCAVTLDSSGNFYVAEGSSIVKFAPGGSQSVFANVSGGSVYGLAFDSHGNLYAANLGGNAIDKITPGGTVTTFTTSVSSPDGLAFDSQDNLYVANALNGTVEKITPSGSTSTVAGGFEGTQGVAVGSGGNIYVTDYAADTLTEVTPLGDKIILASGLAHPDYMVVDVPEPSAPGLLAFGAVLIFLVRRRFMDSLLCLR